MLCYPGAQSGCVVSSNALECDTRTSENRNRNPLIQKWQHVPERGILREKNKKIKKENGDVGHPPRPEGETL